MVWYRGRAAGVVMLGNRQVYIFKSDAHRAMATKTCAQVWILAVLMVVGKMMVIAKTYRCKASICGDKDTVVKTAKDSVVGATAAASACCLLAAAAAATASAKQDNSK